MLDSIGREPSLGICIRHMLLVTQDESVFAKAMSLLTRALHFPEASKQEDGVLLMAVEMGCPFTLLVLFHRFLRAECLCLCQICMPQPNPQCDRMKRWVGPLRGDKVMKREPFWTGLSLS